MTAKLYGVKAMYEDALWVKQTLAGDEKAFHHLIRKYQSAIYELILSQVKDPDDAQELAQDVFLKAYQNLPALRKPEQFHAWLCRIARNCCCNWRLRTREPSAPLLAEMAAEAPPVDEELVLRETIASVMQAVDELPASQGQLLKERYLDDSSYADLQARHGLSYKAITMRLFRARQKVRKRMKNLLSGFAAFPWQKVLLMGGVEAVKMGIKTKLAVIGISVLLVSGGGVLVWHHSQPVQEKPAPEAVQPARRASLGLPDKSLSSKKLVEEISQEDAEKFIAFLDGLDKAQDTSQDDGSGNTLAAGDETPLSYEEELKQRLRRMDEDPEFKALNDRINELGNKAYELQPPVSLLKKHQELWHNPFSVFGLTREEGNREISSGELTKADIAYMLEQRRKLGEQLEEYGARQRANSEEVHRLALKRLEMLGMTNQEFHIALGRTYNPPPRQIIPMWP